ncbi:MAG TPA: hypothetical protein VHJ34_09130 [Actinomycetota bacterium]|nr:hypothetical protein [Actinomycetota bacterium]
MRKALVAAVAVALFVVLGTEYGYVRSAVAVAMGAAILVIGVRYTTSVVAVPPEPELEDVAEYGLKYVCRMCGLELKVEVAAHDRPPRHCGEAMELVRTGGRPPLRPL